MATLVTPAIAAHHETLTPQRLLDLMAVHKRNLFVRFVGTAKTARTAEADPGTPAQFSINPHYSFSTPIGLYGYRVTAYQRKLKNVDPQDPNELDKVFPFATHLPYAYVFTAKPTARLVAMSTYTRSQLGPHLRAMLRLAQQQGVSSQAAGQIFRVARQIAKTPRKDSKNVYQYTKVFWLAGLLLACEIIWQQKFGSSLVAQPATVTGAATGDVKRWVMLCETQCAPRRPSVVWNSMLRALGNVDGFDDDRGLGLIHPNEPYQTVFLSMRGVKLLRLFTTVATYSLQNHIAAVDAMLANPAAGLVASLANVFCHL